jgi:ketosteroid isomerase-like protein
MTVAAAIRERTKRYAALNEAGAPRCGGFLTDDVELLPPGPDNLKGREAAQAFWAAATEHYQDVRLTADAVTPPGPDTAQAIGTYY